MLHLKQPVKSSISKQPEELKSIFRLEDEYAYEYWRECKLASYPQQVDGLVVEIKNPFSISASERERILLCCEKANMAIYQVDNKYHGKELPKAIADQFGLRDIDNHLCVDEDGISPLHVSENRTRQEYIPYTNRPINWHTDGYYNALDHKIQAMLLHCESPAVSGGENSIVDHELAYIHLRDKNPDFIRVLMQDDVMTIPPNIQQGEEIRPVQSGPVFTILDNGLLHMRYTARTHSIVWKDDVLVKEAVNELLNFLDSDSPFIFHHKLQAGQGLICNNVLHKRSGFIDAAEPDKKRLLYRARYYDRIAGN